jgi:hypothetical protein
MSLSRTGLSVREVVGADSVPEFLEFEEDVPQRGMMCEDLDLARTVKQNIIL